MKHLWAVMSNKFPNTWRATYSSSPFNSGLITTIAAEWVLQLTGLSNIEIKNGIDNLSNREEKRFPPNAMEFKELCTGNEYEDVLEAIVCRLQTGDEYNWDNQLAFNFWIKYSFDMKSMSMYNIPKLIKQNLKFIEKSEMFDLPDYTKKSIEKKVDQEDKNSLKIKKRFLGVLNTVLVFMDIPMPSIFQKKLKDNKGHEIVKQFTDTGFIIPDLPEKNELSDKDFKLKKEQCRLVYRSAVKQFVIGLS